MISLSANGDLGKDQLSTSQMKKGEIILHLLLPTYQEPAGAIDPGMRAFHYPAAGTMTRDHDFFLLFLPTAANMGHIVMVLRFLSVDWIIVSCIQTQMLRLLFTRLRTRDDNPIQGGKEQFHIMTVGPFDDDRQGNPSSVGQETALRPQLAAIGRIGTGRGVTERGFRHRSITGLPFPLDPDQIIIALQTRLPEGTEETRLLPFLKAIMDRRTGSQLAWQGIPLETCAQHVDDSCKGLSVRHTWATSFGMRWSRWDQRTNLLPGLVADFPRARSCHVPLSSNGFGFHSTPGFRISS